MVHSLGSYANPVEIFFKISPDHLNIDMSWHVRMIETIKQPLETLLMTPWKWPIWVILHCKNCTSENFRAEGGHHFFFTFFGFPSLILTIRSYPENFIASRKCKVTPSKNTVAAWVREWEVLKVLEDPKGPVLALCRNALWPAACPTKVARVYTLCVDNCGRVCSKK